MPEEALCSNHRTKECCVRVGDNECKSRETHGSIFEGTHFQVEAVPNNECWSGLGLVPEV